MLLPCYVVRQRSIQPGLRATGNAQGKIDTREGSGEKIAILTGVPSSPCTNPYGDYFLGISLRNKQDYARLHGYELHLMAESVDATVRTGPWQKVALLHQVRACRREAF